MKYILLPIYFLIHLLVFTGNIFYLGGNYNQAIDTYSYLNNYPQEDTAVGFNNMGNSYYRLNSFENAIQSYQQALNKTKDNNIKFNANYNLGNSYFRQGQMILFKSTDPRFLKEIENIKATGDDVGNTINAWENAIKAYEEALKVNPNDSQAKENLEFVKKLLEKLKDQVSGEPNEENQEQEEENELDDETKRVEEQEKNGKQNDKDRFREYTPRDPNKKVW